MNLAYRTGTTLAAIAALALPAAPLGAASGQPHEHGVTHLEVVTDGATLLINLRGAGYHLVGFEHAPEDADQREAWADTRERLADAGALFAPSPAARCSIGDVEVGPPAAGDAAAADGHDHHEHGHHQDHGDGQMAAAQSADPGHDDGHGHGHDDHHDDHDHAHDHDHGGHAADWTASYRFNCDAPERLEYIDVGLFDAFPAHEEVRFQRLSDGGQSGGTMTAGDHRLRMR